MKILIIGSGGREHAIAWKIRQSPLVSELYCAPGNAGIQQIAHCINIQTTDLTELVSFAQAIEIDLTVVGPEMPLALGIVDHFEAANLPIFGPRQQAAQIETSKVWAKSFMREHEIPTADYQVFEEPTQAIAYVESHKLPVVVKADGL